VTSTGLPGATGLLLRPSKQVERVLQLRAPILAPESTLAGGAG
jgi:hypothetical protein